MSKFNFGLPGNTAVDAMIIKGTLPVGEAQYMALLAVAFELRTKNLIALKCTPDWLNEARARMGHQTTPPDLFKEGFDTRCNKPRMDGSNLIRCWGPEDHDGPCT